MALETYRAKRRFDVTSEPRGAKAKIKGNAFVIQKHAATRLHYDLRLELDGVMKSWAVTRGPSLVPGEKRLAIHTEDHPIEYNEFEGTIPKGQYGGGTVMIWDRGAWEPDGDARAAYKKGNLVFRLEGEKLSGRWHLVRMRKRSGERQDPWLLIKSDDETARRPKDPDILEELDRSVVTGRTIDEIAAGKPARKKSGKTAIAADAVWHSNKSVRENASAMSTKSAKSKASPRAREAKPRAAKKAATVTKKASPATRKAAPAAKKSTGKGKAKPRRKSKEDGAAGALAASVAGARKAALPQFVQPCLALLVDRPPEAANWVHEVKFDGYRIQARIAGDKIALQTRKALDWTEKFSSVAEALRGLPCGAALIDGEVVVETAAGVSNFTALQEELKSAGANFTYFAFDLLHLDGFDLTASPLVERKRVLGELLARLPEMSPIKLSESFEEKGSVLLKHACDMGLEGIISKLAERPYRSGRNGDWIKAKCSARQEMVIAGFVPATDEPRAIGALILGYYEEGQLQYAGRVGTGYTHKSAREIWQKLQPLARDTPPFKPLPAEERGRGARGPRWVEPKLVAEIDFRGWTGGMRLRHASFKGLREDKNALDVVRETPAAMPQVKASSNGAAKAKASRAPAKAPAAAKPAVAKKRATKSAGVQVGNVHLTNPDRVYWDDAGVTKQDLADFYASIWKWISPHIVGRALSLVRCPEGASGECFFQKHASAGLDSKYLKLVPEDGDHVISIDSVDGLIALVQAGVLEVHVRGSTTDRLDAANRLVFDLDPGPGVTWDDIVRAARDVRDRLAALKLETFVKTSGGKGLHVVLPIAHTLWGEAKSFARSVAVAMAAEEPKRYTAALAKKERQGRIFIDYLRNSREATAVGAYSTRARAGAPVSVPISWNELSSLPSADRYTVQNLNGRLARLRKDPWAGIEKVKPKLPKPLR